MLKDREMLGSELRDKIELYSELTGQDGWNVPITKVADFMSGFEMAKEKFKTKGHWIEHEDDGIVHIECSECSSWFLRAHLIRNSYCPNCGADMRGEE